MNGLSLHKKLEQNSALLIFGILFVSAIGGLVQVLPSVYQESLRTPVGNTRPYSAVELMGRDIYLREGCSTCHSQQIRSLVAEVERYGPYSRAGEFVYDRPFQWGSKHTGPDLHRVGGRYSDEWHRVHLINPRDVVPESNMPGFPWLAENTLSGELTPKKMEVMRTLGVPYSDDDISGAAAAVQGKTEMEALIAYLQNLGTALSSRR